MDLLDGRWARRKRRERKRHLIGSGVGGDGTGTYIMQRAQTKRATKTWRGTMLLRQQNRQRQIIVEDQGRTIAAGKGRDNFIGHGLPRDHDATNRRNQRLDQARFGDFDIIANARDGVGGLGCNTRRCGAG